MIEGVILAIIVGLVFGIIGTGIVLVIRLFIIDRKTKKEWKEKKGVIEIKDEEK